MDVPGYNTNAQETQKHAHSTALGAGRQGIVVDLSYLIDDHTQCPTITFVSIRHVFAQFGTQIIPKRHAVTSVSPVINQQPKSATLK
jgi:hypothetical protein